MVIATNNFKATLAISHISKWKKIYLGMDSHTFFSFFVGGVLAFYELLGNNYKRWLKIRFSRDLAVRLSQSQQTHRTDVRRKEIKKEREERKKKERGKREKEKEREKRGERKKEGKRGKKEDKRRGRKEERNRGWERSNQRTDLIINLAPIERKTKFYKGAFYSGSK